MAAAFDIEQLDVNEDRSSLGSLSGKRVGRLAVHIRDREDADRVASCKSVERLELWSWKEPDLTSIKDLPIRYLRLIRGRQTSVKGLNTSRLKMLWLCSCGKLKELDIPRLPCLWVWACNHLDLDSLGSVRGLVGLDIGMRKEISSLEFVAKCRSLKCLLIDTYSWKTQDFQPLVEAPALRMVGFTRLKPALVEALSTANPRLLIGGTGTNCYMQGGRRVGQEDYLKLRRAFNKKYGL